jgi:hypothetical protein
MYHLCSRKLFTDKRRRKSIYPSNILTRFRRVELYLCLNPSMVSKPESTSNSLMWPVTQTKIEQVARIMAGNTVHGDPKPILNTYFWEPGDLLGATHRTTYKICYNDRMPFVAFARRAEVLWLAFFRYLPSDKHNSSLF